MKVKSFSIEQADKDRPKARCRRWRFWASTDAGRKSKRFNGTWTQAQEAVRAWVSELEAYIPNSDTFASYAESWRLYRADSGNIEPNTAANDKRNVAALLRSPIASMRMDSITPQDCRDALLWIKRNPVRADGELSGATMAKMHTCLHAIMGQAAGDGLIARNPVDSVKPPKVDTPEKDALSPMELQLFLNRVDGLPLDGRSMALYLIAMLGLRRAEACALLDSDVRGGYAYIHQAVKEKSGTVDGPKTDAGVRVLPVPGRLQAKIEEWRDVRRAIGFGCAEYLCCNTRGGLLRPQLLHRWWAGDSKHSAVRDGLGCAGVTLHELRHSNLSMMARHMTPFDLKSYAGWSSLEPAKVYVHRDMEAVAAAVSDAWGALGCTKIAPGEEKGQSAKL